jgi:serine/threonine-protein kinase
MLAGRKPFAEDALHSLPEKIRTQAPQELAKSCPETPPALIRIVERCLRKKRDQRYRTPEQLLVALEGFVGEHVGESGQAHIVRFLVERGLLPATDLSGLPQPQAQKRRVRLHLPTQLRVPMVHAGLLLILLLGVSLLRALPLGLPRSPLAPPGEPESRSTQLLVVADPWAEVFIDGQRIETTPFASPLRLRSGRRYLELRGPYFKAVRQTLDLVPGELRVVRVQMPLLTRGS